MAISNQDIKQLRDETGVGMMDAKNALEAADGDRDKAMEVLRQKGQSKAAKRAERSVESGVIDSYVHMGRVGALIEVQCETDFVARTDEFQQFVHDMAMHVAAAAPQYRWPEDVPEAVIEREKQAYQSELDGKPEDVQERIISGKLDKLYEQICLYKQPFIKDQDKTIEECQTDIIATVGENIIITRFARMELGESDNG